MAGRGHRFTAFLIGAVLWALFVPLVSASTDANQGAPLQLRILRSGDRPASETLRQRYRYGQNFQALIQVPDGKLLAPERVAVRWGGEALPHYTYYKAPGLALIFVLPEEIATDPAPGNYLEIDAELLGGERQTRLRTPLTLTEEDRAARARTRQQREGRQVRVLDNSGRPIAGAFVFGQRRSDLLTQTDARGRALLDRPQRSTSPTHYAWKKGFWSRTFDPITSQTVRLKPKQNPPATTARGAVPRHYKGEPVSQAMLLLGASDYYAWKPKARPRLPVPPEPGYPVTLIAPGHVPRSVSWKEFREADSIKLRQNVPAPGNGGGRRR